MGNLAFRRMSDVIPVAHAHGEQQADSDLIGLRTVVTPVGQRGGRGILGEFAAWMQVTGLARIKVLRDHDGGREVGREGANEL